MKYQTPEQAAAIKLRLNRDLLEEIRRLATRDNRSINSYLLHLLTRHVAKQQHNKT